MKPSERAAARLRLPKWAQQELSRLERDLEHFQAKLREGPEDSNTFADPYGDAPRPLGASPVIEFRVGNGRFRVAVEADRGVFGRISVNGDQPVSIKPGASNSFEVELGR